MKNQHNLHHEKTTAEKKCELKWSVFLVLRTVVTSAVKLLLTWILVRAIWDWYWVKIPQEKCTFLLRFFHNKIPLLSFCKKNYNKIAKNHWFSKGLSTKEKIMENLNKRHKSVCFFWSKNSDKLSFSRRSYQHPC